jgi:hypothetical protein
MKNWISVSVLASAVSLLAVSASAGGTVGAPAPLLGAGLSGLAVLAVTGAGYIAVRMRGRNRD